MEPRVQFAQTKDGVSIAFWTFGDGPPLVQMPSATISPSLQAWRTPEGRQWYEGLASGRMLVRYDNRGSGNSQRNAIDYSLEAQLNDLEAVVDRLELEQFDLLGYLGSGPIAIAFAARHPERVRRFILWCSPSRGIDMTTVQRSSALDSLRETDWEFFTETIALSWFGWSAADQARNYSQALRENVSPEAMQATMEASRSIDASDLLPAVQAPTLVLHRRDLRLPPLDAARGIAAHIPNARLVVLEGEAGIPYVGDVTPVLETIDSFLAEESAPSSAAPAKPGGLVTILFTDMESSTALRQRLGDEQAQELVRLHNRIVRDALGEHGGSEIKHTGDGIMASFPSATGALECAITIQRRVAGYVDEHPDAPLGVYAGLNAGEPIAEEADLFGTAVDMARRLCDAAQPGEIVASNVVRELTAGKGFLFSDRGATALRGFEDPVQVWEVRWREDA